MSDAIDTPATRKYSRKEVNTGDMQVGQKADIDLGDLVRFIRSESIVDNVGEKPLLPDYLDALSFMEEPVTIRIEQNNRSDHPETHVACAVNGGDAEVFQNGQWCRIGWLPMNVPMIVKRKYVEVLARAKSDSIRTVHDDATVVIPRNTVQRHTSSNYPLSIIHDANPKGHEWLSRIMMAH